MNKLNYAQEVCNFVNARGYQTEITENYRNNGSYVAISVRQGNSNVAPVFTVGDETEPPIIFAQRILSSVPAQINTDAIAEIFSDKEAVLSRVNYILVNSELNKNRTNLVKQPINQTLELQYKVDVSDVVDGGRTPLEKRHIEKLGISESEVWARAYTNTMEKYPYKFKPISELLCCDILDEAPQMYVLSNSTGINGAAAILYQGIKDLLDETVGEAIIIPSSVHEMIVIPASLGNKEDVMKMIREVNESCLKPEDILSDRPYELVSDGVLFEM